MVDAIGPGRPLAGRRDVIAAGVAGVSTFVLPSAAEATSEVVEVLGLTAPTIVAAVPIGYVSGGTTGGIRVTWSAVTGATGYEVARTYNGVTETTTVEGGSTTQVDFTPLAGVDGVHSVVIRTILDSAKSDPTSAVTSSAVIAIGGAITTLPASGTPTHIVHTFDYTDGTASSLTLRGTVDLDYLLVGGGGGGGGGYLSYVIAGGGGGGGGVAAGTLSGATGGYSVTVGEGGLGLPPESETVTAEAGGQTILSDGVSPLVAGGGAGGQRGRRDNSFREGGAGGASGTPNSFAAGARVLNHGAGGGGAGAVGAAGSGGGGAGGAGTSSDLTGTATLYGGGGGGGTPFGTAGAAGTGGGGTGGRNDGTGSSQAAPTAGTDGRGGGGGGGSSGTGSTSTNRTGARGGHGIAVVRYALP